MCTGEFLLCLDQQNKLLQALRECCFYKHTCLDLCHTGKTSLLQELFLVIVDRRL